MKKPFTLHAALFLGVVLFIAGCNNANKENCGDDHTKRYFGFNSFSASNFEMYNNGVDAGYVYYSATYSVVNNRAVFKYLITIDSVCIYDDPNVFSTLNLLVANPDFKDTLKIKTQGTGNAEVITAISPSNLVYDRDEIYSFTGKTNPDGLLVINSLSFPTQGSWQADSTYFFTTIDAYSFGGGFTLYAD